MDTDRTWGAARHPTGSALPPLVPPLAKHRPGHACLDDQLHDAETSNIELCFEHGALCCTVCFFSIMSGEMGADCGEETFLRSIDTHRMNS